MGPTTLFTYLKIILLQCFHFSVFSNKQYPNKPLKEHGPMLEPLYILDYKWVKGGTKLYTEALVQWKNMVAKDATWEDVEQLQQQFLVINLGDKVPLQGG